MNRTLKIAVLAAGLLALTGGALGEETKFRKTATSEAAQNRDSAQCWRAAQKTKQTDEQATGKLLAGYLIGGVVGVAVAANDNADANTNPKSNFRRGVHDECMVKRRYRIVE